MSRLLALIDKVVGPSVEMADSAHGADARLAYWIPSPGSADADLLPEFDLLTPRLRDLARNSGVAGGNLEAVKDSIIGHQLRAGGDPGLQASRQIQGIATGISLEHEAEFCTCIVERNPFAGRQSFSDKCARIRHSALFVLLSPRQIKRLLSHIG
ncbi:phage portal protein [Methylocaldum gracile]|uniref:phage portal protein n=1 Tax=Methylocaldum sp. 0917 TaxID=2485163 RepID=UPI0010DB1899